jgi:hypothetical protein
MVNTIEQFKSVVSKRHGMAQANMFQVILPPIAGSSLSANEINILCSSATLPGRQIQTVDRFIGTVSEKVATGSISDDLSFTFKVLNDYGIRKYFETWQDLAYNQTTQQIGYKKDYCKQVIVNQLKKGQGFPLIDASTTLFPNSPFPININLDINLVNPASIIYECKLLEAWPINMDTVTLNNDPDGLVEVTVQLAYTRWSSRYIN